MVELKSAILVIAFDRPGLLLNLFQSLQSAGDLKNMQIVVIHQIGNEEVNIIVNNFQESFRNVIVKRIDGTDKNSTENISFNRIEGWRICFEELEADYVIALEDDVEVSSDVFEFTEFIMKQYWEIARYRGINYGSHEIFSEGSARNFSSVRYGIHGPASAITKRTWESINSPKNIERSRYIIFDGLIEYYLKTGFMVTPENSRYIDLGYGGTHTSNTPDNPYFSKLKTSFVGNFVKDNFIYSFKEIKHSWRSDSIIYRSKENLIYELLYFANYRNDRYLFRKFERAIYRSFVLKKFSKVKIS